MSITERIDRITSISEEYRAAFLPAPRSTKVELTSLCDYACSFCASSKKLRKRGEMKKENFIDLARELRAAGVEELGLFYLGESFMVDWLPEAIKIAKQDVGFPYVFLTTNGSKATPSRVEACMAAGLDSLKFSLNWADEEQFEAVAGVKAKMFHQATTNIKAARAVRDCGGYRCNLYGSYIQFDGDQGERMRSRLADLSRFLDEVYELPLYNQADLVSDENADWEYTAGNRGRIGALRDPVPCWAVFTEAHVTYDLKLSACCFDHDGRFAMGDLSKEPFMAAWNSLKFQQLRKAHLSGDVTGTVCESCAAY